MFDYRFDDSKPLLLRRAPAPQLIWKPGKRKSGLPLPAGERSEAALPPLRRQYGAAMALAQPIGTILF